MIRLLNIKLIASGLLFLCSLLFGGGRCGADETQPKTGRAAAILELSTRMQQLRSEIAGTSENDAPDAAARRAFDDAVKQLETLTQSETTTVNNDQLTEKLTKEVEQLSDVPALEELDPTSLDNTELAAALARDKGTLASLQDQRTTRQKQADTSSSQRTASLRKTQRELQDQLKVPADQANTDTEISGLNGRLTAFAKDVMRISQEANLDAVNSKIAALEIESALKLPTLRLEYTNARIAQLEERVKTLQTEVASRAQTESQSYTSNAERVEELLASIPNIESVDSFASHAEFATQNRTLVAQTIPQDEGLLKLRSELLDRLTAQDRAMRLGVQRFGTSGEIGRALREFEQQFPDPGTILEAVGAVEAATAKSYLEHSRLIADIAIVDTIAKRDDLNGPQEEALALHRELLTALKDNHSRHSTVLAELQTINHSMLTLLEDWQQFSSEHLLWLPSHPVISVSALREAPADARIVTRQVQEAFTTAFDVEMISTWATIIPLLLICFAFLVLQPRFKTALNELAVVARRGSCSELSPTLRAILLTFVIAAEWPMMLMLLGVVFRTSGRTGAAMAFGEALTSFGMLMLWINSVRQCLRNDGLLESHFGWQETSCKILRRWFHHVIFSTSLLLFAFFVIHSTQGTSDEGGLERVVFVVVMVLFGILQWRLLVPWSKPIVRMIGQQFPMIRSFRWLWAGVPVVFPFFLAGLSAFGFHHTALELNDRISWTVIAGSFVILFQQLMLRWLNVASTHTRLQLARQRVAEKAEKASEESEGSSSIASEVPNTVSPEEEVEFFGLQANSLVRNAALIAMLGCMTAIWADVLPALRGIIRHETWSITEQVAETNDAGDEILKEVSRPVTIGDLVFAVFAVALTVVGVRQLPGVIEIVLQSRGFENGLRYAVTTVSRYAILIAGTVVVTYTIGLRWNQVQWLAAGLSVGLGFGLQEVFANFVSGIIILVERPIRIGDIVTLDGVSGVVSRIRIRATSITDWDRREYIVPNREFVTGKLLNWTLSDTTNRVVINVGISYSCDSDEARRIMLEVAADHPNVMKDPEPIATFEGFGDSSLDLILRAYLPNLDNRLLTITELHAEIHRRFAKANINIPFPQRDVNYTVRPSALPLPDDAE